MKKKAEETISRLESKDFCLPFEDVKFIGDQAKDLEKLTCPICYSLILSPVSCKCDPYHLFGERCLHESLKSKSECPLSRQKLEYKSVSTPPFAVISKLFQLKVQCEFCDWQGNLASLKFHLRECGGIVEECPFLGTFCKENLVRKRDLKKHFCENLKTHVSAAKNCLSIEKFRVLFEILEEKLEEMDGK